MGKAKGPETWTTLPDELVRAVRAVRLNLSEIAREYGCGRSFVVSVVLGHSSCPARMRALLERRVEERLAQLPPALKRRRRAAGETA